MEGILDGKSLNRIVPFDGLSIRPIDGKDVVLYDKIYYKGSPA